MIKPINFASFSGFSPGDEYDFDPFISHYFGEITDQHLDDYLTYQFGTGLGNLIIYVSLSFNGGITFFFISGL